MRLPIAAALLTAVSAPALAEETETGRSCTTREVADGFIPLFYEQGKVREAYETWVAKDYIQHNPAAQNGRDAAIAFLEPIFENNPQHRMTVHRVLVDADLIAVHLHGQSSPGDLGAAAVDILRVEGCRIVEHWDVTQPVPETTANGNGMF
jgi:predicted SnoaL-like aldol condensation-catalyzing enzyme